MKTTSTPAAEWPPGGAVSSHRTASQGRAATDFGALLDTHTARTAPAEGPRERGDDRNVHHGREHSRREDVASPHDREAWQPAAETKPAQPGERAVEDQDIPAGAEQQPVTEDTVETPVVALETPTGLGAVPPAADPTAPVIAPTAAKAPIAGQPIQPAAATAAAAAVPVAAPVAPGSPSVTAGASSATAAVQGQAVATGAQQQQAGAAQQGATPQQPGVAQPAAGPQPAAGQQSQQAQAETAKVRTAATPAVTGDAPAQPASPLQQQPSDETATGKHQQQPGQRPAPGDVQRPAASQPVQAASNSNPAPVTAPAAPQAAAGMDAPGRTVRLSQAADAVENIIRIGSQRGVTHARLSLRPAELGGIEIRLQQTAAGLTASVVADGPEAAQALQQAGADLRRQLEMHGIDLRSLDISHAGAEDRGGRSSAAETGDGQPGSSTGESPSTAMDGGDLTPTDETEATSTLELPDGVLVDVLA